MNETTMICLLLAGAGLVVWLAARLYRQGRALSQEEAEEIRSIIDRYSGQ